MRRISTGNAALDGILDGGFPANSVNLVMGLPGTGKTILAESIVFHNAGAEQRALYLSTASEPLDRLLRYVQQFDFYDEAKFEEALVYEDVNETLRSGGLVAAVEHIIDLLKEVRPAFLVIDSFKALESFAVSEQEYRSQLSRLAAALTSLAVTAFLVGEYSSEQVSVLPEFAVADGIVELVLEKHGVRDARYLRVLKLRGSSFLQGEHAFRITSGGLEVYPRLSTPVAPLSYELAASRVRTGVDALDVMFADGLWKGSSTVVFGPPGSGKTLLGLHFIFKGLEMGEKGIIATMQENPTQLQRIVAGFGWDLQAALDGGLLRLYYCSPVDIYIDEFVNTTLELARRHGASRIMVDSLNDLQAAAPEGGRFRDFLYAFTQATAVEGISVIMTQEVRDLFATTVLSEFGISHMSDNVVLLNYLREGATVMRVLSVIKTRASDHDHAIREFQITPEGIRVGEAVNGSPFARSL